MLVILHMLIFRLFNIREVACNEMYNGLKLARRNIMSKNISAFRSAEGESQYFAAYEAALKLWPVPYESFDVTTCYGRTHINACGPKDAYPLVLLHGGYASSTMWFPNISDLAGKFHVLALDTIGEPGKSVPAQQNATRGDLATWLVGVLDELGIAQAQVVGLSRGGWLALNLAIHAPHRLEKIVLLSPAASFIMLNRFFSTIVGSVMHIPTRFVAKMALYSWVTRGFVVNDVYAEQFILGLQNWNWEMGKNDYSGVMPSVFPAEELQQIKNPALMLIGDQDRLNPPKAIEQAKRMIPHIETEIVPHAGHMLSIEQPQLVDARVLKFLTE
jgi:pimeloyl-ACP methyl ester carboxylesterase